MLGSPGGLQLKTTDTCSQGDDKGSGIVSASDPTTPCDFLNGLIYIYIYVCMYYTFFTIGFLHVFLRPETFPKNI